MTGEALSSEAVMKIALPMLIIFVIGLIAWAIQTFAL
jgi:preprotein translocase subunit SecY